MRRIVIFFFSLAILVFINCKNEKKPENKIDSSVVEMWADFVSSNPKYADEQIPESWFFHNNEKDANRLAELTLKGKKKASSGLYYWYKQAGAELPEVGTKHIITDFEGKAKVMIEIIKVDTIAFNLISKEYAALDMGIDDQPLKKWREAHWDFFVQTMAESEETPSNNMLVVCEWFKTIWPVKGE